MKTRPSTHEGHHGKAGLSAALLWIAVTLLLAACGGGGSGGGSSGKNSDPPSASLSYPSAPLVFVVGTAITPVTPTASSGLSSFTVTPALPSRLSLDPAKGTIAGTPAAGSAAATYTVTATGGGASASASVSITVNPAVSYDAPAFTFTINVAARMLIPSVKGGAIANWSVSPSLPAGLAFDTTDGAISGTPTAASAPASYVVTAQNPGGQVIIPLTLEVDSGPLLDLGHAAGILVLRMSGSSVLSVDEAGHWNLWNYASASEIASGDLYCAQDCSPANLQYAPNKPIPDHIADMAGDTVVFVTQNQSGFEVRAATTGQVLSNISASVSWWSLASDGSYLLAGSPTGLFAWSPSGNSLLSLSGDYSQAIAFAAPGQIQIADGPSGQNVIQTVSVPGGASTTGPAFNGQFSSWFLDGSRFMTTAGTTTLVYSQDGVQQALITLPGGSPVVGQGNWIWTRSGGTLDVFAITTGSTPAATFAVDPIAVLTPSATTIAVTSCCSTASSNALSIVDLSGTTPSMANYTLPTVDTDETASNPFESGYAALSASQWVIGNGAGVLLDGASLGTTPRYFDYGAAWSIAGSNGSIAVATASDRIVFFDANTLTQEGVIPFSSSQVLLSSDGSLLAAAGDEFDTYGDPSIRIYELPDAGLLYTWPYSFSGTFPIDIALSGSGAVLGQVLSDSAGYTEEAGPSTGGSPIFSSTINFSPYEEPSPAIRISPDGTNIATSTGVPANASSDQSGGTNILHDGNLVTTVTGYPAGWLDDGHLLVEYYFSSPSSSDCAVYSPAGQITGPCLLPAAQAGFRPVQPVTSDTVYGIHVIPFPPPPVENYLDVEVAAILSVSTGSVSWASGDLPLSPGTVGAVAGNRVVFISGGHVIAQRH